MKKETEDTKLIIEIMEYIKREANDVCVDKYALAKDIYALFTPLGLTKKEEAREKRKLQDILKALRVLGLAEMELIPHDDYRGIPWLATSGYRLTERGLRFLKMLKETETQI
jgi:hypothetical protein